MTPLSGHQVVKWVILLTTCVFLVACSSAPKPSSQTSFQKEERIALVIGNAIYETKTITSLKSPVNDAEAMSEKLDQLGFKIIRYDTTTKQLTMKAPQPNEKTVVVVQNANQQMMEAAFKRFGDELNKRKGSKTVALFYYSGHGASFAGRDYFLTIDADWSKEKIQGLIPITELFKQINTLNNEDDATTMDGAENSTKKPSLRSIFIIDACRDESLITKNDRTNVRDFLTKKQEEAVKKEEDSYEEKLNNPPYLNKPPYRSTISWELQRLKGNREKAEDKAKRLFYDPDKSFIAYATARYQTAKAAMYSKKSPYTDVLLEHITEPDWEIDKLFQIVGEKVKNEHGQQPWRTNTLDEDFYFAKSPATMSCMGFGC